MPQSSVPRPARTVITVAIALLLLVSGAVAMDRFGGDNSSSTKRETLAQPTSPEIDTAATPAGSPAVTGSPGEQAEAAIAAGALVGSVRRTPGAKATRVPSTVSGGPESEPVNLATGGTGSSPSGTATGTPAGAGDGSSSGQPAPSPDPGATTPPPASEPSPLLGAGATVGEGVSGAAAHVALPHTVTDGNPQPDIDITVGRTQVIGNAPPSNGTSFEVSGSLLESGSGFGTLT